MAASYKTRIHPAAIQSLFEPGGDVYKTAVKTSDDVRAAARRLAGRRTGYLRRSISAERHTLPLGVKFTVSSFASYARFVELGTGIDAGYLKDNGKGWVLYKDGRKAPTRYAGTEGSWHRRIKGQEAKNFLSRGLAIGLVKNRF